MFPWGQESVDSITVRSDLHKCIGTDKFRGLPFNKKSIPHVIQVKTDLNRGKFLFVTVLGLQYFCDPFLVFGFCKSLLSSFAFPPFPKKEKKKKIYIYIYIYIYYYYYIIIMMMM